MKKDASTLLAFAVLLMPSVPWAADFRFQPSLALTGSQFNPRIGPLGNAWGVDVNFNTAVFKPPWHPIRTHVQMSRSKEDGLIVTAYEFSPRYTIPLNYGFSFGLGPSMAALRIRHPDRAAVDLWGLGLSAGLNVRIGDYYAGMDARAHDTTSRRGVNYDHFAYGFKVGLNF